MVKRYEPTVEVLSNILTWYKETNNYTEVSRRIGLSVGIVKRIITENIDKVVFSYNGLTPKERDNYIINYQQYYRELEELAQELRNNNGLFQD